MLSMRAQSVSEGFFKFLSLMFQRLSQRDNADCIFAAFGENHDHNPVSKKTNSIPTTFAIIFSRIKSRPHGSFKDFPSIGEVKAMFADIFLVFIFIPFKVHGRSLVGVYLVRQAYFHRKQFGGSSVQEKRVDEIGIFGDDNISFQK